MPDSSIDKEKLRRRLVRIARLMDSSIRIPVIGKRIGWDGIIGLIPGVGDLAGMIVSGYIVIGAIQLGVSRGVVVRMIGNVGLETLVGVVPVFGDLFDMAFRANLRNVALLEAHLDQTTSETGQSDA